ncbi:MAG: peptidylprolyl isomerase [Planctomycetes bacterium]|nr:peptidylprolyl isomerase [Planctomycetota bacterium]
MPMAEIVTERGTMVVELFEDQAPNTVANFIDLAEKGFFDNHLFFRNVANFVAQTGCPLDTGIGGPGYLIPDEFGREDARRHYDGSLSMANLASQPNTAGSQFFVTTSVTGQLNGRHTVFGRVLKGIEAAQVRGIDVSGRANPFKVEKIRILRKRDHPYTITKLD